MTSPRVKIKKLRVEWRDCCSLHAVISSVIYYSTHTQENVIYLFYTIKIQMVYWRILGHGKRKTSPLTWYGVDLTSSVCPLIDHGQQPMKMHTEVTLYKLVYMIYDMLLHVYMVYHIWYDIFISFVNMTRFKILVVWLQRLRSITRNKMNGRSALGAKRKKRVN